MLKLKILFLSLSIHLFVFGQVDKQLGIEYFKNQKYERALDKFNTLYKQQPLDEYYKYIIDCHIALEQYSDAEKVINKHIKKNIHRAAPFYVDLGFIQKQNNQKTKSEESFQKAFKYIEQNPGLAYSISQKFSNYGFYPQALEALQKAEEQNPSMTFDYQKALIYADMGDLKNMYISYLDMLNKNRSYYSSVSNLLRQSIKSDPQNESNILLKELIVSKIQETGNPIFNDLLVWVLLQEKSYSAAYLQLKALDKRLGRNQSEIYNLGKQAAKSKDYKTAEKCFDYIIKVGDESPYIYDAIIAKTFTHKEMLFEDESATAEEFKSLITELEEAKKFINNPKRLVKINQAIAEVYAFRLKQPEEAIFVLENALENSIKSDEAGYAKILLADITLAYGNPWDALVYYAQVDKAFGDNEIGQEARFKKAMVAFYQGDFDWAKTQFDVLKSATSKLISNDAMYMSLVISDNTFLDTDSNFTALKKYARAKLLIERQDLDSAMLILQEIETLYPAHSLADDILWEKSKIYLQRGQLDDAINTLTAVASFGGSDLLADDALFELGKTYELILNDKEKAMEYYQRVFSEHADSILASQARARFRALRGDELYN